MGLGDQLMATGMARGAHARGRKVAFGDGKQIKWDQHSPAIFRDNPNIARPGEAGRTDLEWIAYYKGHRIYNQQQPGRWVWNYDFHAQPGEVFFDRRERMAGARHGSGFVLMEPEVPRWKAVAPNKDWGRARYQVVADALRAAGHRVVQFRGERSAPPLTGVEALKTLNFRDALAILSHAALYIGPEGGLHHGAAALDVPAVVLFGGFIPPSVTGYAHHANLTGGAQACGSLVTCKHCAAAMEAISPDEVLAAANERL